MQRGIFIDNNAKTWLSLLEALKDMKPLPEELTEKVKQIAVIAHETAGCRGVSRVDFMISDDGIPYVIEINTSPGMTETSDLPAQSKIMGIDYDNLVEIILSGAGLNK